MFLLRLTLTLLSILVAPLRLLQRAKRVPEGSWLTLTIDGPLVDVFTPSPLAFLRRTRTTALHDVAEMAKLAAVDANVKGLLVVVKSLECGLATTSSLRRVLGRLRAAGKEVVLYFPGGLGTKDALVAAAATRVFVAPRTSVAPVGFARSMPYFKSALDKVGVEADVMLIRICDYGAGFSLDAVPDLAGLAEAKSAEGLVPTMEQVATAAPRFGANIKKLERNGLPVFATTYSQGEGVHFGIRENRVMFGSPMTKLDEVLTPSGATEAPVTGLTQDAVSAVVDLTKLSASVRALPADAWGLGGFAMKATTVRWLDATDDLTSILVSAGAKEGQVHAQVSLTLRAPDAKPVETVK